MIQTVEAVIDEQGQIRLLTPIHLSVARRAVGNAGLSADKMKTMK